jgi:hypothetical protein
MRTTEPRQARARARQFTVQLTPELAERVDALRAASAVPPSEAAVVRAALVAGLPALEARAALPQRAA